MCIFRKLSMRKCIVCYSKLMDYDYGPTLDFKVINYNFQFLKISKRTKIREKMKNRFGSC